MWICDPLFLDRKPVQTLHKQLSGDRIFVDKALRNRHMLVRRTFDASKNESLTLTITADDYYKLYVNGQLIGVGPAQAYADRYMTNTYDLSAYLHDGENLIAAHVFYMGTLTRAWQSGDQRQGLWMQLKDENGIVRMESDKACRVFFPTAWKERGLLGYQTQFIEEVFGSDIPEGWKTLNFDDSAWAQACENPMDDHTLIPQPTPPVDVYEQKPVLLKKRGDTWFADMGEEIVGTVTLSARAESGKMLTLRMGEELNPDGSVRCPMRCNCDYTLLWHLSGRRQDEIDFFDYMAFRYIEIDDAEGCVIPDSIRVVARNYPMKKDVGIFRSSDEFADSIFRICRRGVELGAQEAFLDCPSREKGQYLGDGTITAHAHLLLTGDKDMYRKMLMDFAASAVICPGLMAVAPGNEMQEIADYSCQYPEQIMTYYELTGDMDTVRELMPVVDALENYFDHWTNEKGLIDGLTEKWNLVDWPHNLRDDYDFVIDQPIKPGMHNVINAFYYGLKRDADRMRALLNLPLRRTAEKVRTAYIEVFRKENGLFRDAERSEHTALHSVVLPLYYGITDEADIPAAVELIRAKRLCCGVYMAYFVLKALSRCGEYALMNELLFSDDEHSWGNMLREGATSCWEAWGREQKNNTSLCHPWASAPIVIMIEDMAGIRAAKPGFEEIIQNPHMPAHLNEVYLNFGTVRGVVEAEYKNGGWTLKLKESEKSK